MTALSLGHRPRGLTWSTFRLHRPAVWTWTGFVVLLAVGLTGLYVFGEHVERVNVPCGGEGMPACSDAFFEEASTAVGRYTTLVTLLSGLLAYMPLAIAAWAGALLVARDVENGTAELAWTQSAAPLRWLAERLAVPAVLLASGTAVLTALYHWVWASGDSSLRAAWFMDDVYRATGPVGPASVLLALASGALAGLVTRRTLPALGMSFCVTALVQGLGTAYRALLWPKAVQGISASGHLPGDEFAAELGGVVLPSGERLGIDVCRLPDGAINLRRCLQETGATDVFAYVHPAAHYWPLQLVETGVVLALTAVLTVAAFRLLRRRLP